MSKLAGTEASGSGFFEHWSKLATENPEQFERERKEAIEEVISQAPAERKEQLRRLQWRIDMMRSRASNPLASCIALNRMMWEFLYSDGGLINALRNLVSGNFDFFDKYHLPPPGPTHILPFKK